MAPPEPLRTTKQAKRAPPPGIARADSDDELGVDDHPWEWIYADKQKTAQATDDGTTRKRKRITQGESEIVGARMGSFMCSLGDTVLLKAEGSGEAWVGIICDFLEEDDGEKAANFMWFSSEKEIRNKEKKRMDNVWVSQLHLVGHRGQRADVYLQNELYLTPSWDVNPLASINGKAKVMSLESFQKAYSQGKIPRSSKDHGKVFVCRRGCNTRTTTYTDEFLWEKLYHGMEDIPKLTDLVKSSTKATRRKLKPSREESPDALYDVAGEGDAEWGATRKLSTPKKARSYQGTPKKSKPVTPSSHRR